MTKNEIVIVIPSLDPDEKLNKVVDGMIAEGFPHILLVDDGSDRFHKDPFERAKAHPEVSVLVHEVNKGKGRALKTAFTHIAENMDFARAVITIDGDGQHTPQDASKLADGLDKEPYNVMMGCRDFLKAGVPKHNRFGNRLTSAVFKLFFGMKISDTQTGLRGIPVTYLKAFSEEIEGERFEYETNMLIYMSKNRIPYTEIPIETLYIEENKSSHFKPLRDSYRIYRLIFDQAPFAKHILSSVVCTLVDLILFTILGEVFADVQPLWVLTLLTTGLARVCSALLNYTINRRYVFRSDAPVGSSLTRYVITAAIQMACSWLGITALIKLTGAEGLLRTLLKACVDLILFVISFFVQKRWVFGSRDKKQA
jgi:putative flippase GtrA